MSSILIKTFVFDDANCDEFAAHGLSDIRVDQVLQNDNVVIPNRRQDIHPASYIVIGRDNGGAPITIPVQQTQDPTVWRPVTAWTAEKWDLAELRRRGI